uniref:histone acetyltransferase n=1 Tax=Meloidogyne javanica TaxID=6303 RepID=A0A915LWY2_MELJA
MNDPGQQQPMRNQPGPSGGGGPPQNPPPPSQQLVGSTQPQDPEKRKLIQQQLVLLLHAHKCQQRDKVEPLNRSNCNLPYCSIMKGVLEHMVKCTYGRQCQFAHCASSRQIISHWKNCTKEDCPVCNPVKKYTHQQGVAGGEHKQGDMILNPSNFVGGGPMLQQSSSTASGGGPSCSSIPSQPQSQVSSQQLMFGSPPSQATTVNTLLDGYNPNPFRSTNPPNKTGGQGNGQQQFSSNDGMPLPEPPATARDWHVSITPDLRNHLVGKLVKAIFPSPDPAAIHDQRIRDLITYARKVEKDMFEQAPDKEAYYHMLAEKIYKIQKELQEKKNRRLNEQQNQQLGGGQLQQQTDLQQHHQALIHQQSVHIREIKQEPKGEQQQPQGNQPMLNFVDQIPNKRPKIEEPDIPSTSELSTSIKMELTNNTNTNIFPSSSSESASTITNNRRPTTPKESKPSTSTAPPEPIIRDPKIFSANELRSHLLPVWQKLWDTEPECIPFRLPVDPEQLNIPDYFDIVKNPMDLKTIKDGLDQGKYKNPWEVHKWCTRLSEIFIEEINPVMRQMGYCCGQKLSFTPLVQFCFGITKNNAACVIARDQPYFMYECSSSGFGVTVAEKYIYCVKCFEALPEKGINLNENTSDPPKKWHRICALNNRKINPEGFICEQCRVEKSRPRPENKFTAKKLPHCQISRYIEDRVNNFLRQKLDENDPEIEVIIRVLSSSDKEVEVKPQMLKKYGASGYPERFAYRSKAIFAFEVLKDPDTGISTEYVKRLGYTMAHIWACPPSEGDDYIFHCHPTEQKIPKPKRLQDWYKTMLNNGNEEGTVYSYKDIFNQAKDDGLDTPTKLPYFEGDYWPRIIDECIQSAEKDEEIDKRKALQQAQTEDSSNLSAQNTKKKGCVTTGNPVVDRLFQQLEKHRDVFFTIRLFSVHDEQIIIGQKPRIEDPDPLISCELMDTRDNFLAKSRDEHWEFSQLRRAKWSTLNFCYTLHTQEQESKGLSYTCNVCEQSASYHCNTCDEIETIGRKGQDY